MRVLSWLALGLAMTLPASGEVLINEIMYNPAQGERFEYVELTNSGTAPVNLGGWKFTNGIDFTFPDGTVLDAGAYLVVSPSREALLAAYPSLPAAAVLGDYEAQLANDGERLTLADATGRSAQSLRYDDNSPWDFLADGFGASLERICAEADPERPESWRSSPVPLDPETEFGGTPGAPNTTELCPPVSPDRPPVFLSEIMYHPVLEESLEQEHEYLEIHNAGNVAVPLAGWRIAAGVEYTFPAEATIAAGGYLVIARNPARLAEVPGYNLTADNLLGPYSRSLDDGGEKIALVAADGQGIDSVNYDDEAPWPIGADGLGAGEEWLPDHLLPLEDHRHKGHSLERIRFDLPASAVANWAPSPLDGMTPGRPNASASAGLLPIALAIAVAAVGAQEDIIRDGQDVLVEVEFAPAPPASARLEYFIEDLEIEDEAILTVPLEAEGEVFRVVVSGQPENTIVRYRIRADRGNGDEIVSPRSTDPQAWHAYFVAPVIDTETRVYQLFIGRRNWGRLNTNIAPNRVTGCNENPRWDAQEPAIFIHDGKVFDAHVRFQGSRWNRANGPAIPGWRVPGPTPGSVAVRSWRIALPRYRQLGGDRSVLVLNKLTQGCPGYNAGVGYRLFAQADLPSPEVRFVQFHINGQYYHYMMEYERPGEDMMQRYHREMAEKYPDRPREKVGHMFKSIGCTCDEGPFGWGDWRLLNTYCGHEKEVRYAATDDRKTHDWDTPDALIKLMEDMHAARAAGVEASREFILENFDLELLMNFVAIINYQVPFDDMFQNHFIYQRLSDRKWVITPWDLDQNFGEWQGANSSLYLGMERVPDPGIPGNRSGWWHRLKDTLMKSFREEYEEHLLLLNNTLLHPDNVFPLVEAVTAQANLAEAMAAPARLACGTFAAREGSFKTFVLQRHDIINTRLAGVTMDAGSDQTVFAGTLVQFDASGTQPDPGPDAAYTWSNGMEGEKPTFKFDDPGVFEITLTLTTRNTPFQDRVTVTVLPVPELAFGVENGTVVIEAENHFMNERRGNEDTWWEEASELAGFSGAGYMHAVEANRKVFSAGYASTAPELRYVIRFPAPATYRVWIRGLAAASRSDTVSIGLNGTERDSGDATDFEPDENNFVWSGINRSDDPQEMVVEEAGLQLFSVWIRESNFIFDKVILTQDTAFVPAGVGPGETGKVPTGDPGGLFIRGDVNADRSVDIADAVGVLTHLFAGTGALTCADHGDVDDNGNLQATDAIALLGYLFRSGAPPRSPFPGAGIDPTPDQYPCGD